MNPYELPERIAEASQRRLSLRRLREETLERENSFQSALSEQTHESAVLVSFSHPLADSWPEAEANMLKDLNSNLRKLSDAKQAVAKARRGLKVADQTLAEVVERRARAKKLGLILLVVVAGAFILSRLRNKTALNQAIKRCDDCKRDYENACAFFSSTKLEVETAWHRVRSISAQILTARFEEDTAAWERSISDLPGVFRGDWSEHAWRLHDFSKSYRVPFWVAGLVSELPAQSETPFVLPVVAPLLGGKHATVLKGDPVASLGLMHSLVLQLAALMPYGATFTLLDPSGAGRSFPMQRALPFVRPIGLDIGRDLEAVWEDIGRIIRTHIDAEVRSFEQLSEQTQANERYEFIVASNFPDGYDRRAIETLQKIAKNGPVAGKYLFLQLSAGKQLPRDLTWEDFGPLTVVDTANRTAPNVEGCKSAFLAGPQSSVQSLILHRLNAAKPPEHNVQWSSLAETDPSRWWKYDAGARIEAPIGSVSRGNTLDLWFGVNREGRPCAHGVLGAMPGSGKSNLYHVFICGLATRYSPEELNFYLIDGKMGVEFQVYRRLPHARVVALNSAPELSRSVLAELVAEMERRNELFGKLKVVDLPGYRKAGSPAGPCPRIVLMIDEYQELFEDDRLNQASSHLLTLAQQGRSAGIHLLLGSQRFGAAGMLNQAAVFGSVHLRMAMRMSHSDVQGLTEFGRNGKRLVEQCDLPGKIVVNANSGDENSNEFGKVALLDEAQRSALVQALERKADAEWPADRRFATVVFDGREQPNFAENPQIVDLVRLHRQPTAEQWRSIATSPVHEQGFGVPDWYNGERPMALWLGQELNVHGQARIVLRRRAMENVLLVGENLNAIYGIVAGLLSSVAIGMSEGGVRVFLADRAIPGTLWEGLLDSVCSRLFTDEGDTILRTRESRTAMAWLEDWTVEQQRRSALDEEELQRQPTWLLVLAGVDRLPSLARILGSFGSSVDSADGEKLRALYTTGPILGMHVVLSFPSAGPLKQCLDRAELEHFKHRVVTQMAEADSFLLLGNDHGARLQRGDGNSRPVFAIYQDHTGGSRVKFKPYTVDAQIPWDEQLNELATHLSRWRENCHVHG